MRRVIPAGTQAKAVELLRTGMTVKAVAGSVGVSTFTISRWAAGAGITFKRGGASHRGPASSQPDEPIREDARTKSILFHAREGKDVDWIAMEISCHRATVRGICEAHKVAVKEPPAKTPFKDRPRRHCKDGKVRNVEPVAEFAPVEGPADTRILERFTGLITSMELKGSVAGVFVDNEWQMILEAKKGIQELLLIRSREADR